MLEAFDIPLRRHFAQPLDAGVFHRGVGVEALGDGVGDDGLAFFLQQLDQSLLFLDQPVDPRGFVVKEGGNGALFI